jgi:hypothetical protein
MVHLEFNYTVADLHEVLRTKLPKNLQNAAGRLGTRINRGLLGWLIFISVAIFLYNLLNRGQNAPAAAPASPPPANSNSLRDLLVPLIPWLLIFGFIWFFAFRQLRNVGATMWRNNPRWQMPTSLDIGPEGLHVTLPVLESHWRWNAFLGWAETKNLFILVTTAKERIGIPKRAIDPALLDQLRYLFQASISPRIHGFPVLPPMFPPAPPPSRQM